MLDSIGFNFFRSRPFDAETENTELFEGFKLHKIAPNLYRGSNNRKTYLAIKESIDSKTQFRVFDQRRLLVHSILTQHEGTFTVDSEVIKTTYKVNGLVKLFI